MRDLLTPAFLLTAAIAIPGIAGQIIASRHRLLGWSISLALQPLWYAFYIVTGGYPGLLLSTGYLIAAAVNIRAELHARGQTWRDYPGLAVAAAAALRPAARKHLAAARFRRRSPEPATLRGETS